MSEIRVTPVTNTDRTKVYSHPKPSFTTYGYSASYIPAKDNESNLLVLFHGIGDGIKAYEDLVKNTLKNILPETSFLVLQGTKRVPFWDEAEDGPGGWCWWDSFDFTGELLLPSQINPSKTIQNLRQFFEHLIAPESADGCNWHPSQIHLFGFAQGGTLAGELALSFQKAHMKDTPCVFRSIVSVSGELLTFPTAQFVPNEQSTSVLFCQRKVKGKVNEKGLKAFKRAFGDSQVQNTELPSEGISMLRGSEWENVIRFWSRNWNKRNTLMEGKDIYKII